jgi:uncharacterized protein YbaR (Trm112 family)
MNKRCYEKGKVRDMKKDIMNILCCPACKGNLHLMIDEEDDDDVITGTLSCSACNKTYPIENGIADLLIKNDDEAE